MSFPLWVNRSSRCADVFCQGGRGSRTIIAAPWGCIVTRGTIPTSPTLHPRTERGGDSASSPGWPAESVFPFSQVLAAACRAVALPNGKVGISPFTPGRFRHSVATWACENGAAPAAVSALLGDKAPQTTKRF